MPITYTKQGCKVETVYEIQPNGTYWEKITLSTDPAFELALEESRGKSLDERSKVAKLEPRYRR
jgi:hypothetical protein